MMMKNGKMTQMFRDKNFCENLWIL
jgi:hypothetical protein